MKFIKYIIKNKGLSPPYLIHMCLKLKGEDRGLHWASSSRGGWSPLAPPLAPCMAGKIPRKRIRISYKNNLEKKRTLGENQGKRKGDFLEDSILPRSSWELGVNFCSTFKVYRRTEKSATGKAIEGKKKVAGLLQII
jgi:hypothetical protein